MIEYLIVGFITALLMQLLTLDGVLDTYVKRSVTAFLIITFAWVIIVPVFFFLICREAYKLRVKIQLQYLMLYSAYYIFISGMSIKLFTFLLDAQKYIWIGVCIPVFLVCQALYLFPFSEYYKTTKQ